MSSEPADEVEEGEERSANEEEEDLDLGFLKPDHPLLQRFQKALQASLLERKEKLTLQLCEQQEELKKLLKHHEELGVTLYHGQHSLAKCQQDLEQLHENFTVVESKRKGEEAKLNMITSDYEKKGKEVDEMKKRLAKANTELQLLNQTVRQVGEYNEQLKAEIQVSRRTAYKAEDHIKMIEKLKVKQDLIIDRMNEEVKTLTQQKGLLDAQLVAQKQETEAAMMTLREANAEMEAIEFEKKQLLQQWRASLVGMQRRDEQLQNVQKALNDEWDAEMSIDNEVRGVHISIKNANEDKQRFNLMKEKYEKETQFVQTSMNTIKLDREKLMDSYNLFKRSMESSQEETSRLKTNIMDANHKLHIVERTVQKVSQQAMDVMLRIEEEVSEQTTVDRASANSQKRIKQIFDETQAKEVETQNLNNEIARVTVDSLNTKAHNQMLRDRHKQLRGELAEREKLIEQYEQEIRRRHHQIEKKQLYVDRLNREYEDKRLKLEAEVGEADIAGPQEAKIKHLRNTIFDLQKECMDMQKDWIQKQTQLLTVTTETDKLKSLLSDQKNRKIVLQQKRLRVEGQLDAQRKEIKDLQNGMKHLQFDLDRMNTSLKNNDTQAAVLTNDNQRLELDFVQKLKQIEGDCLQLAQSAQAVKEEKINLTQDIVEAERQVMLWERKITLEKEMQEALDPLLGQAEAATMQKEIHRMELRLDQLKRTQEQMIVEMEKAVDKWGAIAQKFEPKVKKNKKAGAAANTKRQIQSLRTNLKLCTQHNAEAEDKIAQRERELEDIHVQSRKSNIELSEHERIVEALRVENKARYMEKQRKQATLAKLQRTGRRHEELAVGTASRPHNTINAEYAEQVMVRDKIVEVAKTLLEKYDHLELLWNEVFSWLEVPRPT